MRQYHVAVAGGDVLGGDPPRTPETPRTTVLPDGRQLKSALKTHTRLRPWESDEKEVDPASSTPAGAGIKKTVRIHSRENMVRIFEKDSSSVSTSLFTEEGDEEGQEGGKRRATAAADLRIRMNRHNSRNKTEKSMFLGSLTLLGWAVSSSWLIFLNRDMMQFKGFPLPLMLPAISQLGCAAIVWSASAIGLVTIRPWSTKTFFSSLFPLVAVIVLCMSLGNYAHFGLSLSFLNIFKALTPAVTLLLSAAAGMEQFTPTAFCSTLLIAYGTGVAILQETSQNDAFQWVALIAFASSILFEGLRVVLAAHFLGSMTQPYSPVEILAHVGPGVFVVMGAVSLLLEREALLELGVGGFIASLPDLVLICVLSFLVNICSYYSILNSSSTTFKVVGKFLMIFFTRGGKIFHGFFLFTRNSFLIDFFN